MPEVEEVQPVPRRSRRVAREAILQSCYMIEVGDWRPLQALYQVKQRTLFAEEAIEFIDAVVLGIADQRRRLDSICGSKLAQGWKLERVPVIDQCVLRMALYELLFIKNIPAKVSVDEAVTLAKKYSSLESAKFVNGVLGNLIDLACTKEIPEKMAKEPVEPPLDLPLEDTLEDEAKVGNWVVQQPSEEGA